MFLQPKECAYESLKGNVHLMGGQHQKWKISMTTTQQNTFKNTEIPTSSLLGPPHLSCTRLPLLGFLWEVFKVHCITSSPKIRLYETSTQNWGFELRWDRSVVVAVVAFGPQPVGTRLVFLMHCQMRNSSESRNFNSKVLAKAKQKQNSNNKTIGWPFEGQAVRTGGAGLEHCLLDGGCGLLSIMCPSRHQRCLGTTTEKDMEQHILHSHK